MKHDRQCTYNVTLRRFRATIVAELHIATVCVCSLIYPACNAHEPYCRVTRPAQQYFSILSHERHDFRKRVIKNKMCVLISSTLLSETFLILRRTERDMIKKN